MESAAYEGVSFPHSQPLSGGWTNPRQGCARLILHGAEALPTLCAYDSKPTAAKGGQWCPKSPQAAESPASQTSLLSVLELSKLPLVGRDPPPPFESRLACKASGWEASCLGHPLPPPGVSFFSPGKD